jgi:hypothetical protein
MPPERAPRPKAGPAEAAVAFVRSERLTDPDSKRETDTILSWRLLWSVASQATTNSYTCQPQGLTTK